MTMSITMVAQALSKKAGVEFSIADISGDDLMSQREALATQGVKVRWILTHNLSSCNMIEIVHA